MKAADLIRDVRESNQRLWNSYQLYLATNGEKGMNCFTPDSMERLLNRTDEEIIAKAEAKGLTIDDKEEYLNKISK